MGKNRISGQFALVLAALVAVACADSSRRSPVGPSSLGPASATTNTPAAIGDDDALADWAVNTGSMTAANGQMVEGSDVVTAVTGVCPDRVITMRGVPVLINSGTMFGPGVSCNSLAAGARVRITGWLMGSGGALSVIATAVAVDQPAGGGNNPGGPRGRNEVRGEGTVSAVRGSCPSLALLIRGYAVTTSSATTFTGGTCVDMRPGVKVAVTGVPQADSLLAQSVEFKD